MKVIWRTINVLLLSSVILFSLQCADGSNGRDIQVTLPTATPEPNVEMKVYISGAVERPGVYVVQEDFRLADVVELSGGPTDDANLEAVNLAVRVEDEDHWHIPRLGDGLSVASSAAQNDGGSGKIDLNSASIEQLKTLPGIGDVKAQSIIAFRESNGDFASVDDLIEIRGIGPATLESIRDLVDVR